MINAASSRRRGHLPRNWRNWGTGVEVLKMPETPAHVAQARLPGETGLGTGSQGALAAVEGLVAAYCFLLVSVVEGAVGGVADRPVVAMVPGVPVVGLESGMSHGCLLSQGCRDASLYQHEAVCDPDFRSPAKKYYHTFSVPNGPVPNGPPKTHWKIRSWTRVYHATCVAHPSHWKPPFAAITAF